jgi:hypothetical protein
VTELERLSARAEQLQKLADKATPTPWYAVVNDLIGGWMVANVDKPAHAMDTRPGGGDFGIADFCNEADAEFIAAARTAVPELAGMVKRLVAVAEAAATYRLSGEFYGPALDAALAALDVAGTAEQTQDLGVASGDVKATGAEESEARKWQG